MTCDIRKPQVATGTKCGTLGREGSGRVEEAVRPEWSFLPPAGY